MIGVLALVAALGPWIRPDHSTHANTQQLSISKQKPGFEVLVVKVMKDDYQAPSFWEKLSHYGWPTNYKEIPISTYSFENNQLTIDEYTPFVLPDGERVSQTIPLSQLGDGTATTLAEIERESIYTKKFILGTDLYGRDLLSRLMGGAIISLAVGLIAVLISLLVGITLGALAGYYRGWVDQVIMWLINVVWSIPTLLLVMAIVFAFGKGFEKVFIAVGLTMWVEVARVVRGQVLGVREKEYVEAGRALGYSQLRIIFRHILPNVMNPVIVISAANFAAAILIEAGLSFLGIGAKIPTPSWGNMIKEHYAFITTDLAYLAILPGVMIMLMVLSFILVGNGLRDAFDTR